jgi:hypothetical protein
MLVADYFAFVFTFGMFLPCDYYLLGRRTFVQAIQPQTDIGDKKQAATTSLLLTFTQCH